MSHPYSPRRIPCEDMREEESSDRLSDPAVVWRLGCGVSLSHEQGVLCVAVKKRRDGRTFPPGWQSIDRNCVESSSFRSSMGFGFPDSAG